MKKKMVELTALSMSAVLLAGCEFTTIPGEALKAAGAGMESLILVGDRDLPPAFCFPYARQGEAAFFRVVLA